MASDGADILLLADTGGGNYTEVGKQTDYTHDQEREAIDISAKQDDHEQTLYGRKSDTISLDALYVEDDAGFTALEDALSNGNDIIVRRQEDGSELEEATAQVESISENQPDNDAGTVSVELILQEEFSTV